MEGGNRRRDTLGILDADSLFILTGSVRKAKVVIIYIVLSFTYDIQNKEITAATVTRAETGARAPLTPKDASNCNTPFSSLVQPVEI